MAQRFDELVERGTGRALVTLSPQAQLRPSLKSGSPQAAFISQLIAEHYHLAPQRVKRRAPVKVAQNAYDRGLHISDRRLPAGWTTTRDA
jgi:hypothetical protein